LGKWFATKKDINVGFVVSLKAGGIIVPAIHHTDLKSIDEIMEILNDIIPRAAFKLRSSELTDSTITLTSVGENGADSVYGIIYPPQVAIVGFGQFQNSLCRKGHVGHSVRSESHISWRSSGNGWTYRKSFFSCHKQLFTKT
jgi:pyruvate dehydrogenase E2 component (dihydrolipoamide acetyltransferase)